jgi:hypothetical protein
MRPPASRTYPLVDKHLPSQRLYERIFSIRHLRLAVIDLSSISHDQWDGSARAPLSRLLSGWLGMGLPDGLATTIRFRLSSRAREGAEQVQTRWQSVSSAQDFRSVSSLRHSPVSR